MLFGNTRVVFGPWQYVPTFFIISIGQHFIIYRYTCFIDLSSNSMPQIAVYSSPGYRKLYHF